MADDSMTFKRMLPQVDLYLRTAAAEFHTGEENHTFPIGACETHQEPHVSRRIRRAGERRAKAAPWYRRFSK